jgi:hypothetical protein
LELGKTGAGEKNKVVKMVLMYTFLHLQNRWLVLVLCLAADKDIIDYLKYNLRSKCLQKLYQ